MKKKRVWCPGGGQHLTSQYDDESRKTKPEDRKVKHIRCSVCDQRFEIQNKECHDPGCVHGFVPNHKAY